MNFSEIISLFENKKILVIGDLILDRYIFGKVNRISPEAPVPVVEVVKESFLLGGATNVANNIISLGGSASIAGIIGSDISGKTLTEMLKLRNINTEGVFEDKRPTSVKTRVIAHSQQVVRFDKEDRKKLEGRNLDNLLGYINKAISNHDGVIISDYKKGVVSSALMSEVVSSSKLCDRFVAVDPKIGHFHLYKDVSLITPNLSEASHGSGIEIKDEKSLIKAGKALIEKLSCFSVLITRGDEGMTLFKRQKGADDINITHFPTMAKKVFDVTGAGDTVIAAFTIARCSGATMEESAVIANHAAGLVVGEVGTAVPEIDKLIKSLITVHSSTFRTTESL
jgi:D-beta-D-heptose 7-phosphate kinase/D-beta-D-heptose 1-phosphate adenosyltransferase